MLVQFRALGKTDIMKVLQRICDAERLYCEREALRYIADISQGDLRAAINDLQAIAEGYGKVTLALAREILRGREKKIDIWRTLNQVFYAKASWMAKRAVTNSEEDYETLIAWLNDNIVKKYEHPGDLFRAYDALSRATVFLNRAKFGGNWSLLSYVFDLIGPGIAFARREGGISKQRYSFPEKIRLMAALKETRRIRDGIAERIASRIGVSKRMFKAEVLPYLFIIFRHAPTPIMAARLALGYGLTREEVKFLAGPRAKEVLDTVEMIRKSGRAPETGERKERAKRKRKTERNKIIPKTPIFSRMSLFGKVAGSNVF
jgi:replication factor C large subunit